MKKLLFIISLLVFFSSCNKDLPEKEIEDLQEVTFRLKVDIIQENLISRSATTTDFFAENNVLYYQVYKTGSIFYKAGSIEISRETSEIKIDLPDDCLVFFSNIKNAPRSDRSYNDKYEFMLQRKTNDNMTRSKTAYTYLAYNFIDFNKTTNYDISLNIMTSIIEFNIINTSTQYNKCTIDVLHMNSSPVVFYAVTETFDYGTISWAINDNHVPIYNGPILLEVGNHSIKEFLYPKTSLKFYDKYDNMYMEKYVDINIPSIKAGAKTIINIDESKLSNINEEVTGSITINEVESEDIIYNIPE